MYQIDLGHPISVFFCGIGGISMSGLAQILKDRGFRVLGSDRAESDITRTLRLQGIQVIIGQTQDNITSDLDLVVFTAAIHPDNPEYRRTQELGIPSLTRAQLLGEIMRGYPCSFAVAGTHGKTTTTSMLSEILISAGCDPTVSVGGMLPSIGGNIRIGHSDYCVAEACEYTNSFLSMTPEIGIILNVDADHLDFFRDLADIRRSFRLFAERIPKDGLLIIGSDIPDVETLTDGLSCRVVTFGDDPDRSDCWAEDVIFDPFAHPTFTACLRNEDGIKRQQISLRVPGRHNVTNALAALSAAREIGIPLQAASDALANYEGTGRRFEYKGDWNGIPIIDDYAHHPTEIRATLLCARAMPYERTICIFQPHTYTRTYALMEEFAAALSLADVVILADIYAARETDTLGISSQTLADKIRALGHHDTYYLPTFDAIKNFVRSNCRSGDLLITMGAGNVTEIGPSLLSGT